MTGRFTVVSVIPCMHGVSPCYIEAHVGCLGMLELRSRQCRLQRQTWSHGPRHAAFKTVESTRTSYGSGRTYVLRAWFTAMRVSCSEQLVQPEMTAKQLFDHTYGSCAQTETQGLEKYLLTKLYDRTFGLDPIDRERDHAIAARLAALQVWLRHVSC